MNRPMVIPATTIGRPGDYSLRRRVDQLEKHAVELAEIAHQHNRLQEVTAQALVRLNESVAKELMALEERIAELEALDRDRTARVTLRRFVWLRRFWTGRWRSRVSS